MIFHRLGLIHKNQRGVALIELLLAFLITGVITGGITMTIFQVFSENTRSTNHMIAVRQVQNAGYWLSRDTQMAQSVVITGVSGFPLTLTWTDWETGAMHQVVYELLSPDNKLQRSYSVDGVPSGTTFVAEFVDTANTNCEFTGGSAFSLPDENDKFTITDAVGGDSGTITVTAGTILVTATGGATYNSGTGDWTTPAGGGTIEVAANEEDGTSGIWTSTATAATASAAITDGDAILSDGGELIVTITTTVGEASETRVYEIMPRPNS